MTFRQIPAALAALALAAAPLAAPAEPITITDQLGKTVTLDGPARRVVVLPKPGPNMVIAVAGGTDKIIGMHPAAQSSLMDGILGKLHPEIAAIPTGMVGDGFTPNIEEMLAAEPDVVIQWGYKVEEIIEPMERVGIPVVAFSWGTYEIEAEQIALLGKILGEEDRAAAILDWHKSVRDQVDAAVSGIPHEDRARIIFFSTFSEGELAAWGRDELIFQVPGLRNVVFEAGIDQGTVVLDAEQVLEWDPDIIFLNFFNHDATPQDVYDDPRFQGLSAVQNRRVYKSPRLTSNSNETPLLWAWFASVAYPDRFSFDHVREIAGQFEAMYGVAPSGEDIDDLLHVEHNSISEGYAAIVGK